LIDQPLAGLTEATRKRAERPAQSGRGVGLADALEIAQHERRPFRFGQLANLFVDRAHERGPRFIRHVPVPLGDSGFVLALSTANGAAPRLDADANSDTVQPCRQGLPGPDGGCAANERQEHRLERIFGVGVMSEHVAANSPHERAMAEHQFLKCSLVPVPPEPFEQVGVRGAGVRDSNHGLKQRQTHHP
jgi:hypothetical protein